MRLVVNASLVVATFFAVALPSCSFSEPLTVHCDSLSAEVATYNRRFAVAPATEDISVKVDDLKNRCEASIERNYQLAIYDGNKGDLQSTITLLNEVVSDDPELEPQRLAMLYWAYYATYQNRDLMVDLVREATQKYPDSPYSRMIIGVQSCRSGVAGKCADALSDLKFADESTHEIRLLPYLAYAYADAGDFKGAAAYLDQMHSLVGDRVLDDRIVYIGVVTYANVGRASDARELLSRFLALHPGMPETKSVQMAKEVLRQNALLNGD